MKNPNNLNDKERNTVEFRIRGDYALFSDPLTRVGGENNTYSIPTYEAIKGILKNVYWKPTFIWYIDEVRVMNRIQTEPIGTRKLKYAGGVDLSHMVCLKDVEYQVRVRK